MHLQNSCLIVISTVAMYAYTLLKQEHMKQLFYCHHTTLALFSFCLLFQLNSSLGHSSSRRSAFRSVHPLSVAPAAAAATSSGPDASPDLSGPCSDGGISLSELCAAAGPPVRAVIPEGASAHALACEVFSGLDFTKDAVAHYVLGFQENGLTPEFLRETVFYFNELVSQRCLGVGTNSMLTMVGNWRDDVSEEQHRNFEKLVRYMSAHIKMTFTSISAIDSIVIAYLTIRFFAGELLVGKEGRERNTPLASASVCQRRTDDGLVVLDSGLVVPDARMREGRIASRVAPGERLVVLDGGLVAPDNGLVVPDSDCCRCCCVM